jgi:hypothetical protein
MKTLTILLLILIFSIAALAKPNVTALNPGEPYYPYEPGEILVKFTESLPGSLIADLCSKAGDKILDQSEQLGFYRIQTADEAAAIVRYRSLDVVQWANFNYIAKALYTPNDTFYPYQWHYNRINLPAAWDITRGSAAVKVAVCDMGFYFNHADWAGVQTNSPYDFVDNDNNPATTVYDSHGAHVAGTIFAATNNNLGVAGIAPLCTLMPIRCLNDSGSGTIAGISNGISWAATHGANVLNLSLGFSVSGPPQDPGPPLSTAINQAAAANVVICAASGNDDEPYVGYPAAYEACIAVGATGYNDAIAPYSNRGTELDVVAPGGNTSQDLNNDGQPDGVLSTGRDGSGDVYIWMQGTSMATPHVAGVAALLLSHGLAASQVRQALEETAVDLGTSGWDATFGYGRIDAAAALAWQGGGGGTTTLLNEGFEGSTFPPSGWEVFANGGSGANWVPLATAIDNAAAGTTPHSGTNAAFHNDDSASDSVRDWLITPPVTIPSGATQVQLSFFQRNYYMVPIYYGLHAVLYSTNSNNYSYLTTLPDAQATWGEVQLSLDSLAGRQVWFAFYYVGNNGSEWYLDDVSLTANVPNAAPDHPAELPAALTLGEPYPNPFNSTSVIPIELSSPARVELSVYNMLGQRVTTLLPLSDLNAGTHRYLWNAEQSATGTYLIKLSGGSAVQTRKITLVK